MTTPPTTPSPAAPAPQFVPPPPPPYAPAGRGRRWRGAVVAAVIAAVVAAGLGTWWWTRGDDGALAGRPRVTDTEAGLSYGIPEGWKHDGKKKLIDAFTTGMTKKSREDAYGKGTDGGFVAAGKAGRVPEAALARQTERAARSNAVFFYPEGSSELKESKATTVDGHTAHTVALAVKDGEGGTAHLRLTLIIADRNRTAFLLGLGMPGTGPEREEVDTVLSTATVL
ncbi:hypothetical protein [Streptomyces sp. CC224B]|uniref:hypothetical protein n=1 Tax=Streptomyces sp. CC224B TaxID=3044571 RepID=UPI0024A93F1E|nr:hypothetical protein [Streptomyces sp. CC224B]